MFHFWIFFDIERGVAIWHAHDILLVTLMLNIYIYKYMHMYMYIYIYIYIYIWIHWSNFDCSSVNHEDTDRQTTIHTSLFG